VSGKMQTAKMTSKSAHERMRGGERAGDGRGDGDNSCDQHP
jgi:hypothetical protein